MSIIALGLNHKTAPVDIREKVTFGPDIIVGALRSLQENPAVEETVILSTCNRTEVYCSINQKDHEPLADWISRFHGIGEDRVSPYLYSHFGLDAVKHLLRVSCGLDSLVLGEPQILGQVKAAFQTATDAGTTGKMLFKLFQHAFSAAKQIRTDTAIGNSPVSVAFAAVSLAKQIFSDLSKQTALLIGAGETIELATRHLNQHGIGRIIVANRTVERAHNLAAQFDGYAIALTELSRHLAEADIVISSTASPLPVLGKGSVESALKERRHSPIFMVDIAVPRDIEPEVADLSDIYLYTVDDLDEVIQENMRSREEAAEQAEEIIDHYVGEYMGWLRSLDAVGLIQDYRSYAERLRDEVMQKALQQLAKGKSPEEVMQFMAHTLTNKLLHNPSAQMRQAGFNGQVELLEAANTLFQLNKSENKS
ncbi:MAG: glutamyl-tRNA reductase [Candidatus Thiodiazotropha taylori]|nr:glutamyl-tRNA reductase [Candidatus Thiodiazotropha taylori]MCW4226755.1 glutamyl-tRNA reductase [Candidatus Thiodiazotropha endolucinida]MCG7881900.1 glutamyl-tRNA reductase [Candidatus Thiodiazotropha taylori]MCG7888317.1 glutamyl-tRNA reductase [Candidatus Thiodiazotropha taylori]MCG7891150.1 glutamyl-tRNA reductase [Candidatus Thiodiazotropha taylori]